MKLYKIDIENATFATKKPKMVAKVAIICFLHKTTVPLQRRQRKRKQNTSAAETSVLTINQTKKTSYENQGNH